jgi:hypothetical protein
MPELLPKPIQLKQINALFTFFRSCSNCPGVAAAWSCTTDASLPVIVCGVLQCGHPTESLKIPSFASVTLSVTIAVRTERLVPGQLYVSAPSLSLEYDQSPVAHNTGNRRAAFRSQFRILNLNLSVA